MSSSGKHPRFSGLGLGFNADWQADESVSLGMQRSELSGCMLESEWFIMTGDVRWRETGSEEAGRRQVQRVLYIMLKSLHVSCSEQGKPTKGFNQSSIGMSFLFCGFIPCWEI